MSCLRLRVRRSRAGQEGLEQPPPAAPGETLPGLFARLGTTPTGLDQTEATRRLGRFGPNVMTGRHKRALRVGAAHGPEPSDWGACSCGCSGRMKMAVEHFGFGPDHVVVAAREQAARRWPPGDV